MMVEKILTTDLQKIGGHIERKICAVGVTKILTESKFACFLLAPTKTKIIAQLLTVNHL